LGLVISKNLVIRMGGAIDFKSQIGQGTTFRFSFATPIFREEPRVETVTFVQSRKILVVDDSALNLKVMVYYLKQLGCTCEVAYDGNEAVLMVEENKYGLIFMDLQMPVMNGMEATKKIRRNQVVIPIIAVTATVTDREHQVCIEAGMNAFLTKPIQRQELVKILVTYLGADKKFL